VPDDQLYVGTLLEGLGAVVQLAESADGRTGKLGEKSFNVV